MKWSLKEKQIKKSKSMKKEFMKKSWSVMLALGVVLLLAGGIFVACQKETGMTVEEVVQDQGVEYPIPENAIVSLDKIRLVEKGADPWEGWFDTKGKGDPVSFGGANFYYLPKDIKNYEYYRTLLQGDGVSKYNILRYTLGEYDYEVGGFPVIKVELPSQEERQRLERSYEPIPNSELGMRSTTTMTLSRAKQFFNQFKNLSCAVSSQCPCIPFQYAADGCYARAHYMRKLMADAGYESQKIFAYAASGRLQAQTKAGCCQAWGWHVAPLVGVETQYSTQLMVIDRSLYHAPVSINDWINKMKSTCAGYLYPTVQQQIRPSYVYLPDGSRDDNYSKTYAKMEEYSTLSGCDWWLTRLLHCIA